MKYALRLLWHGAILLARVGWILLGALLGILAALTGNSLPEKFKSSHPDWLDVNHPSWDLYWGDDHKK